MKRTVARAATRMRTAATATMSPVFPGRNGDPWVEVSVIVAWLGVFSAARSTLAGVGPVAMASTSRILML